MTTSEEEEERKLSATAERFCRRFSLAEIQLATQDFSEARLIGKGGFGNVYKGLIDDGKQTVAMKRLAPNSNQGEGEFFTEIETLSKLRHVNLVSLIGYCHDNAEMILVYEYIPRGTLADHRSSLTWKQCLNLCIGAARGIDYLHTGTSIIHRDVKSTNILLDENFTAKVSDFGLAKHLSSKSYVSTLVKGSFGYLDPSYFSTCRLTQKSDTYAFGVVMLEVLCGRPAVDPRLSEDEMCLVMWAQEKIRKGKADQITASNLRDEISADCLKTFVGIAKRCLNHEPKKRPSMDQVVGQLEFALEQQDKKTVTLSASRFLPFWNRVKPSDSSTTGSTQQGDFNTASTATQEEALNEEQTINMLPVAVAVAVPAIPIYELEVITDNFCSERLIDHFRFGGNVYRGTLKSGQDAAIKVLCHRNLPDEEFLKQVSLLSSLQNENIAQLLGYCVDGRRKFFVYEYAQNGSLYHILQGFCVSKPVVVLSWAQRVKIAVGAAKGIQYIHQKEHVHCNITSKNILLYDDGVIKLADFGLSAHYETGCLDKYTECYPFTLGHTPEYLTHGEVCWKSDVYSFGVLLVELLTGRKLIDHTRPRGQQHLVQWAMPKLNKHEVKEIVDARLNGNYPRKAIEKMVKIAVACLQFVAEFRPDMSMVLRDLYPLLENRETPSLRNPSISIQTHQCTWSNRIL